ncbi:MAG TPA: hypothetical protein VJN71_05125 [Nitrososphaerales archaeon]|nr:hypothetical protein [Nitrososphaerales archaeon]
MSQESGKPFGFGFVACFCLFFGGALIYLAILNTKSILDAFSSGYGIFGSAIAIIGIGSAVAAAFYSVRGRMKKKIVNPKVAEPATSTTTLVSS